MSKKIPLVSVIILTYNQEKYIAQNLESVLAQEVDFDYEIILADDCSSDNTPAVCQSYQEKYPDKIVLQLNQTNKGIARNYFDCLEIAQGKYIGDCGGDDYWIDTRKLQKEIDLLEKYPILSVVYSNWKNYHQTSDSFTLNNQSIKDDIFHPDDYGKKTVARFLNRRYTPEVVLSAACYRKSIIMDAYRQYPEIFCSPDYMAEDISVTAFLLSEGPAYYMAEEHLAYRVLSESISHSKDDAKYYRFALASFRQTMDLAAIWKLSAKEMQPYCDAKYPDYLHYAYLTKNKAMGKSLRDSVKKVGYRPSLKQNLKYFILRYL